jgi:hypothetical protein
VGVGCVEREKEGGERREILGAKGRGFGTLVISQLSRENRGSDTSTVTDPRKFGKNELKNTRADGRASSTGAAKGSLRGCSGAGQWEGWRGTSMGMGALTGCDEQTGAREERRGSIRPRRGIEE